MDLERDLNKTIEMINSDSTYRFDRVYPFQLKMWVLVYLIMILMIKIA